MAGAACGVSSRRTGKVKPIRYALRARTAGWSSVVGMRTALAGTVITATVLPVMSKNSTEYPSSADPGRQAPPISSRDRAGASLCAATFVHRIQQIGRISTAMIARSAFGIGICRPQPNRHHSPTRSSRIRGSGHGPRTHADPSDQHPGDEHLGESGTQYRNGAGSLETGPFGSSGCSGWIR